MKDVMIAAEKSRTGSSEMGTSTEARIAGAMEELKKRLDRSEVMLGGLCIRVMFAGMERDDVIGAGVKLAGNTIVAAVLPAEDSVLPATLMLALSDRSAITEHALRTGR